MMTCGERPMARPRKRWWQTKLTHFLVGVYVGIQVFLVLLTV